MKKVGMISYFGGNLFSANKAFESFGCQTSVVAKPSDEAGCDALVLPGVGAFGDGMRALKEAGLVNPIKDYVKTGRPFLGICLGMQAIFSSSEEFGFNEGLGLVPGKVLRLPEQPGLKIPNIGWSPLSLPGGRDAAFWKGTILDGYGGRDMYFVHSFAACPERAEDWLAHTAYGSHFFCSAVRRDNVWGCQFHPEKSGPAGLAIVKNFLELL